MDFSLASRAVLRVLSWIVPRDSRNEWHIRWHRDLAGWQVLRHRGELRHDNPRGWLSFYRKAGEDAWTTRMTADATQATLQGPGIVVIAGAALLILMALCTHAFRGARSFLAPIPIKDPATLVSITYPARPSERAAALARLIPLWQDQSKLAREVAAYRYSYHGPRAWVSWNFLPLLGVKPAAGRSLQAGDRDAVLLSYPAWRALYGGNPRIVGSRIRVRDQNYTVVGVMPELFWALSPAIDIWAPLDLRSPPPEAGLLIGAAARLRSGATADQLAKELSGIVKSASPAPVRPVYIYSLASRLPGRGTDFYLLGTLFAGISCLVMVTREHRRPLVHAWRYWPFLAAKVTFAVSIPLLAWMELDSLVRTFRPALGPASGIVSFLTALLFVIVCARALWWSFADQRRRCPVCLRRLAMPVSVGSPASVFEPALTELVCPVGHGALSMPDDEADRRDRWIALDSSWGDLFKSESKGLTAAGPQKDAL